MPTADTLNDLRRKIVAGEEVSREELRSSIDALVGERLKQAEATPAKGKAKSTPINLDDLLG